MSTRALESVSLQRSLPFRYIGPVDAKFAVPLVLLLHGNGGDERSWDPGMAAMSRAISDGSLPSMAAVAPATGTSWWVDGPEAVETAVVQELLPMLTAELGLEACSVFVAGFSMGGFGAVRYALAYPERFEGAIVMSPALYDDVPPPSSSARSSGAFGAPFDERRWRALNYPSLLAAYEDSSRRVPMYICVGDQEPSQSAGWRFNSEYQAVVLFERLKREADSPARLRIGAGGHDWGFWIPSFLDGLRNLVGDGHAEAGS